MTNPSEHAISSTEQGREPCEPRVEDAAVILVEVDAFLRAADADLQALHAAVTRFVVHCRERGENIERIISTLQVTLGKTFYGSSDMRSAEAMNHHLLAWVLDAYYTRER